MKKRFSSSRLFKIFEEASFLGFAVILIGSSIVLASTISSRNVGALPKGAAGWAVLDNNIALSVEVVGHNASAVNADGEPALYNGEKTELRVRYHAEGGPITAGSRAEIQMPVADGMRDVFFAGLVDDYPQTVGILDNAAHTIGEATVSPTGLVEILFHRGVPEGENGVFTIDGKNIFILRSADEDGARLDFGAANPGSPEEAQVVAATVNLLSNDKGLSVTESPEWAEKGEYGDGARLSLNIKYKSGSFGAADGDLIQLALPTRTGGEEILFDAALTVMNLTERGYSVGAAFVSYAAGGEAKYIDIVFYDGNDGAAELDGTVVFPLLCRYEGGYKGGDAAYGTPILITGGDAYVLTRAARLMNQ